MFEVIDYVTGKEYTVYAVTNDPGKTIKFLICKGLSHWKWEDASCFMEK